MRAAAVIGTALAVLSVGCGGDSTALPPACSDGPQSVLRALRTAPRDVHFTDGTRLSACVSRAQDDAELQQLGFSLTPAADRLARNRDERSAFRLGYLVGAVRSGAATTNGVHLELVRRLESTVTFDAPALLAAARRGARAGEMSG